MVLYVVVCGGGGGGGALGCFSSVCYSHVLSCKSGGKSVLFREMAPV